MNSHEFITAFHAPPLSTIEAFIRTLSGEASIGVFLTDPAGHTLYLNPSLRRLAGLPMTPTTSDSWLKSVAPEDHDLIQTKWAGAIAEHRSFEGEFRFRRADGSICWVMAEAFPLRTDVQALTGYVGIVRDVTQRQLAMDALRAGEDRYRSMILLSPHAVLVHANGTILCINQACQRVLGSTTTLNIEGRPLSGCFSEEFVQALVPPEGLDNVSPSAPVERRFLRPDGTYADIEMTFLPLRFAEQPATQVIITDLTAQKEIDLQLEQAKKTAALATLAGGIAHEFNNCLTAIMGFSDLALPLLVPDSRVHGHIQQVALASKRARDLVTQMLLCGRQGNNVKQSISLDILLKETLRVFRGKLGDNITLREWIPGATKPVLVDLKQIHEVFINLLAHSEQALKVTGGVLEVRLDNLDLPGSTNGHDLPLPRGQYVRLTVSDTGEGVNPDVRPRLVDAFFMYSDGRRGADNGLSDVQRIVSEHGGTFRATSTIARGTTIEIYLPAMSPHDSTNSDSLSRNLPNLAEQKEFLAERDKER